MVEAVLVYGKPDGDGWDDFRCRCQGSLKKQCMFEALLVYEKLDGDGWGDVRSRCKGLFINRGGENHICTV